MIDKIPEELRAKLKGKEEDLEKAILELREYAKEDLGEKDSPTPIKKSKEMIKADCCSKELCLLLQKKGIEASYSMRFEKGDG